MREAIKYGRPPVGLAVLDYLTAEAQRGVRGRGGRKKLRERPRAFRRAGTRAALGQRWGSTPAAQEKLRGGGRDPLAA